MTAVPPAPERRPSEIPGGGGGVHLLRDVPLGQSILWHPTSPTIVQRRPPSGPYPVFIDQKAIAAVNAHYETAGRQGMMGFLVGDLFESPANHQRYVVIDSTIRLNQAVYGDKTLVIVSRLWDRIQEELNKTEGHLIGWYHSHPPITVELAPGDVETHLQYFKRPWHVALVLGSEHEGPVAGLFRPKPGETSASLPFYELIDEADEGVALATKQSVLPWINFLTDDAAAKYANGSTPQPVSPPPTPSALQVVKPVSPTPKPVPGIPSTPSGKVSAVKPAASPAPPAPAKPAAPAAPAVPVAPAATAQPRPPAAAVSTTGTMARPALGDRPQPPAAPSPPKPPAAQPPPRRDTQMKSPHNALSDLPILAAGGYELGDVDARESEPGVVRPRARDARQAPAVPLHRPTTPPKPFAPALVRRSDGHPGLVAFFVLALIGGGGFAGWKYYLQPRMAASSAVPAAVPDSTKRSGTSAPATGQQAPATAAPITGNQQPTAATPTAAAPTVAAPAAAADSPFVRLDRNADSVTSLADLYNARVEANQTDCPGLGMALVAVEDAWTRYNVGKRRLGSLDGDRFTRDQRLYAAVDSVERDFDRSGCTRP
jgi:proteasome lid subunit RPN8/RPN11